MSTNEVDTRPARPTVMSELKRIGPFLKESLPSHMSHERFVRLTLTTLRKNPKLMQCNPESFVAAIYTAAALGLEIDVNGEAYVVPYKTEAQFIVGYQGVAKLFWQHPMSARLSAEYVCENDEFTFDKGLSPTLHHTPAMGDRGKVVAYYAIVGLQNGATWFDVFSPATLKALRGGKVGPDPRFKGGDPEHWMERKTALKQVLKLAPKSTQMQQMARLDEQPASMKQTLAVVSPDGELDAPGSVEGQAGINMATGEVIDVEVVPDDDGPTIDPWTNKPVER